MYFSLHAFKVNYPSRLQKLISFLSDSPTDRAVARLDRDSFPSDAALCQTMRRDSSVTKRNIHDPSDSSLHHVGIRVLSRLFAKGTKQTGIKRRLKDYRKPSRQLATAIFYGKKDALYKALILMAERVVKQSENVLFEVESKAKKT